MPGVAGPGTATVANGHRVTAPCHRRGSTPTVTSSPAVSGPEVVNDVPPDEIAWPSEADLRIAEHPAFVLLCRVLTGLRRLSFSDSPAPSGVAMPRETHHLVDLLRAAQSRIGVLAVRLADATATPGEQREFADQAEELADLLRSHADDIDAGIVAAPRFRRTEREPA